MRRRVDRARIEGRGIEWDALLALLARETRTPMGRDRAFHQVPLTAASAIRHAVALTGEARAAIASAGPPPLDGLPDVRPVLGRARAAGSVLEGRDLSLLLPLLDVVPRAQAHGAGVRDVAPEIAELTDALPRCAELRARLRRSLDDEGALTDEASPALGRLRRDVRTRRRRLVQELERMLHGPDAERVFADRFVTVRHGRYVLPVRAEARGRVRGIVHDRSQSGQTLFIEPESLVDTNNELVELAREEAEEAERILAELTGAVRERGEELDRLVDALGELDWVYARARAADRMRATAPDVDDARIVDVRAARHPLLLAQTWTDPSRTVVAVDLQLSADRPILLITGPNAGGKTVALKTLGLLALMAQIGCHIPAADGSRLPAFDAVWAIVGDEQSVAENLSTFSAFLRHVREVLASAAPGSLVLLDELGAGTDPDEGAALAQAILEALDRAGALVTASTHLEPLKAFASTYPRARNASVEFDTDALAPTFRLRYDLPGQSYALAIAARLGLPAELIARAQEHRSAEAARMSELLARLDAHARREADHAAEMQAREAETSRLLAAAREAEAAAAARARDLEQRAKREASQLLSDVRRAVSAEWDKLRRAERSRPGLEESRRHLREVSARVAEPIEPAAAEAIASLAPGMRVRADHLGLRGEIASIAGATATVTAGALTVRVPLSALRPDARSGAAGATGAGTEARRGAVPEAGSRDRPPDVAPAPGARRVATPAPRAVTPEVLLLGKTTDEARDIVDRYLDDAFVAGLPSVRVVHGKGSGALRKAVRELLTSHPLVESFRDGEPGEGGAGATVARLKVS
jgi:DNA mismatch repair protein MutS2